MEKVQYLCDKFWNNVYKYLCCKCICCENSLCCGKVHLVGCCCPSHRNSDRCNDWARFWVDCFYNKVPKTKKDPEKGEEDPQFFQKHKLQFVFKHDHTKQEYFWCCGFCDWPFTCFTWCGFDEIYLRWNSWKKRSLGHSFYTCFSEPIINFGFLNIWCPWFRVTPMRTLLIAGLQGAGKTFLMRKLLVQCGDEKIKPEVEREGTKGYVDTVITFNLWQKYEVFDIGGRGVQTEFWRTYYGLMVKFDTIVYCIRADTYLRANFSEDLINKERKEFHRILASPELRACEIICYMIFDETTNLTWKEKESRSLEILSALEVRNYTGANHGKTKFPQQKVNVVTNYPELLEVLGVDAVIHGNAILSAD
uniref:Uncharacterized protein n=1 Tax=Lotharella oceanica TaxID=641309 RepID=A0A7S2TWD3_9EUKA